MRFNHLINSHFSACKQVLELKDEGRHRIQKVFAIGEPDLVGISDGAEAWIASVHLFERFDLRSIINTEVRHRATSTTHHRDSVTHQKRRAQLRTNLEPVDSGVDS